MLGIRPSISKRWSISQFHISLFVKTGDRQNGMAFGTPACGTNYLFGSFESSYSNRPLSVNKLNKNLTIT